MKNPFKMLWNCLLLNKPLKYLATNNELVRRMSTAQKFDYAINAVCKGLRLWDNDLINSITFVNMIILFISVPSDTYVQQIENMSRHFHTVAKGNLPNHYSAYPASATPVAKELGYAFWSLQRMLALAYPEYDFKLEGANIDRCDYDEALSRIASSIVSSVAIAHGHAHGLRRHNKVYRQMLDYGKELLKEGER